jgi:hypothetical protein
VNDDDRTRLLEAIAAFNRQSDEYFDLYDPDVVLHGYPEGVDGLEAAKQFYRSLWEELPEARIEIRTIEDAGAGSLRVRFDYAGQEGLTTLRFVDGLVVERWQGS